MRVTGEEAGVARLGCLQVGREPHLTTAERHLHMSIVILHQGSTHTHKQKEDGLNKGYDMERLL